MIPKGILDHYIGIVVDVCDIDKNELFSKCKREDIVDARHILIKLLSMTGAYPVMIAHSLNITPRAVTDVLNKFNNDIQSKKWMRTNYEIARKKLGIT